MAWGLLEFLKLYTQRCSWDGYSGIINVIPQYETAKRGKHSTLKEKAMLLIIKFTHLGFQICWRINDFLIRPHNEFNKAQYG